MLITYEGLKRIREDNRDKRIAFSDGTFDMLHLGHLEHLKSLRTYGEIVIVGVMSDQWVRKTKGAERPIMNQEERAALVDSVRMVDYVVCLYDENRQERIRSTDVLRELRPDVFLTNDPSWESRKRIIEDLGTELHIVSRTPPTVKTSVEPISTTNVIKRISALYGKA